MGWQRVVKEDLCDLHGISVRHDLRLSVPQLPLTLRDENVPLAVLLRTRLVLADRSRAALQCDSVAPTTRQLVGHLVLAQHAPCTRRRRERAPSGPISLGPEPLTGRKAD